MTDERPRESALFAEIEARIDTGMLPWCLEGGDATKYRGREALASTWSGFARMWWGIAWVRLQGFQRDGESCFGADE